jgi:hypothetical protein
MGKKKKPTETEIIMRLSAIKMMVAGMKNAMPTMASELRRSVCEDIDELVEDIRA